VYINASCYRTMPCSQVYTSGFHTLQKLI